jgi:hypothetical protein
MPKAPVRTLLGDGTSKAGLVQSMVTMAQSTAPHQPDDRRHRNSTLPLALRNAAIRVRNARATCYSDCSFASDVQYNLYLM